MLVYVLLLAFQAKLFNFTLYLFIYLFIAHRYRYIDSGTDSFLRAKENAPISGSSHPPDGWPPDYYHPPMLTTNAFGNVDITHGVPPGYVHVAGKRLQPLCRKLDVPFAPALTGWGGTSRYRKPVLDGVVVPEGARAALVEAIAARAARAQTPEQRARAKARRQHRDTERFAAQIRASFPSMPEEDVMECAERATEIGSGRVGRSSTAIDPVHAAVVAHVRHAHTDYDDLLDTRRGDRDTRVMDARQQVAPVISAILKEWATAPQSAAET